MSRVIQNVSRLPYDVPVFAPYVVPAYRGGGGAAWSPADLSGILDYGVRNTANLYIARDGSGANATATDDLVGTWNGELGVLSYRSTADGFRPRLDSRGVRFDSAAAASRILEATSGISIASGQPMTVIVIEYVNAYDDDSAVTFDLRTSGGTVVLGRTATSAVQQSFAHQGTTTTVAVPAAYAGQNMYAAVYSGSAAWDWTNGTKTSLTLGVAGNAAAYSRFQNNDAPKDGTMQAWIVMTDDISDADWGRVRTWGASL